MSTRYLNNLALTLVAGFLVVATQAFIPTTVAWLTFAMAITFTILSLELLVVRTTIAQRVISGLTAVIGIWTIVASLVFPATTVVWLGLAAGAAVVALGVAGLTAHELTTERVVHSFEVERQPAVDREPVAA
jgi:hypothetical protein